MSSFLPSIEEFNQLPVESQQSIISRFLANNTSGEEKAKLTKFQIFLEYLNKNNDQRGEHLFSIVCQNKERSLEKVIFKINEIELSHQAIEMLYNKSQLISTEFENLLSDFESVSLEIKYPSSLFNNIYSQSVDLKRKTIISKPPRIIISIFITGITETDKKFRDDKNVGIIRIDRTVQKIRGWLFQGSFDGCSSLTQIIIPSSITEIGNFAFYGCSSLTQVTIPSSLTEIERSTFNGCSSLTQITIPSSVTKIGSYAFELCSSLTQITIPSGIYTGNLGIKSSISITKI